jgi:plasmid stabilization system protein ParE
MKRYKVRIDPEALSDIQEITDWYNNQLPEPGKRFQITAIRQINTLHTNPQIYAIRYREIRCMIVKKFPYLVHFYINEEATSIEVLAVISTDRNPKIWTEKTG